MYLHLFVQNIRSQLQWEKTGGILQPKWATYMNKREHKTINTPKNNNQSDEKGKKSKNSTTS